MKRFIEEVDRTQLTLLPESLDDYIGESNPVRAIEAFVAHLDLADLGFEVVPEATGRPGYHPSVLLRLYIYGYLNRISSSRCLEREAGRNLEVIWLLGRLAPDDKVIADFRKDNGAAIKKVCVRFVELCRQMGLLTKASVAIDGSKFKAVNNRDKNFTRNKIDRRRAQLEESVLRYLRQLETADRQEPTEALAIKAAHLKEKLAKLKEEMGKLDAHEKRMLASPDGQISLTDPDSRSMATSGRGSGVVGYNVQVAVDTENHLIVTHEVTNTGSDRSQLANVAKQAKAVLQVEALEAVADRGYYNGEEIIACDRAGVTVTLPKPMTSGAKSEGRFGKQDFAYLPDEDVYRCPANEKLSYRYTNIENGQTLRRYWTNGCGNCALKELCTTGKERRITRHEDEHVLEAVQRRLDSNPQAMRQRRETVEHPFGTIKARMGATHFLTRTLPKVATEMALAVLAYNLTRVLNIMGVKPMIAAMRS
jgi:transposase